MADRTLYYGGSFDPVGNHHLFVAQLALEQGGFDKVMFCPVFDPPHRDHLSPFADRVGWLRAACDGRRGLDVSEIEAEVHRVKPTSGPSYTIHLVSHLCKTRRLERVPLLVGGDSFDNIEKWHLWEVLVPMVHWVVVRRSHTDRPSETIARLSERHLSVSAHVLPGIPKMGGSSTLIRERLRDNLECADLIPAALVRQFWRANPFRNHDLRQPEAEPKASQIFFGDTRL